MLRVAVGHARRVLDRFLRQANRATSIQQRVLLEKIQRNAGSQFGRDFGFNSIKNYDDFRRQVPVMTYDDLAPYVDRVKRGDFGAMFGGRQKVHMLAKTSGTSDKPKYVPVTTAFLREYRRGWNAFGVKAIMDHPGCFLRHIVQMTSPMDEEQSEGGLLCGAITGLMAQSQKSLVRRYYVVPPLVGYIADPKARYYAAMRFAAPRDVAFMITASPATQLSLARIADRFRETLIRDVHDGGLSESFDIAPSIRDRLSPMLPRDPEAASRLELAANRHGRLLPKDYWRLGFLANWMGGTMGLYIRDFPEYFGDTPVRDIGLLASEGRMSIPIEDGVASGILETSSSFFEFIPEAEYESDSPTVLRSHELEVGERYYILMTTSAGFYRYDIGDCVQVTGYHGEAPMIEFLHKADGISSITGEKITERQVVNSFHRCARVDHGDNFVLAPRWGHPPYYVLYVENNGKVDDDARTVLAEELDRELQNVNVEYASKRRSDRLGPIRIGVVEEGYLSQRDQAFARRYRQANEQYKHRFLLSQIGDDADFPSQAADNKRQPSRPVIQQDVFIATRTAKASKGD